MRFLTSFLFFFIASNIECSRLDRNRFSIEMVHQTSDINTESVLQLFKNNPDITEHTGVDEMILERHIDFDQVQIWVCKAKQTGQVIAFLGATNNAADGYFIDAIAVDRAYRRLGIATNLLQEVKQFATQKGCSCLTICPSNDQARDCYEAFGFSFDGTSMGIFLLD